MISIQAINHCEPRSHFNNSRKRGQARTANTGQETQEFAKGIKCLEVEEHKVSCPCVQAVNGPEDKFMKLRHKGSTVRNTVSAAGPPAPPFASCGRLRKTIPAPSVTWG